MTTTISDDIPESVVLLNAARDEYRALKQARADGKALPPSPNLTELQRRHADMTSTTRTKVASTERSKARTDIRYFHDGRSMPETHKAKLSTAAYFYTARIKGDSPRISTKEFIDLLAKLGVKTPGEPGWIVELPNGITFECRVDGKKSEFKGAPKPAAKATKASKAANVVAPPKPTAPVAKALGDRNKATRQVTPIPKTGKVKSTRKAPVKKASAAARSTRKTVKR